MQNLFYEHRFELGRVVATKDLMADMECKKGFREFVQRSFGRYVECDWGELCDEDKALNDDAVRDGTARIHASYVNPADLSTIWIITEADRSATTLLYPYEY